MILSDGVLLKAPTTIWEGSTTEFHGWPTSRGPLSYGASYSEIYRQQIWVTAVVNKLATGEARLATPDYRVEFIVTAAL